jgi:hypothetical protein
MGKTKFIEVVPYTSPLQKGFIPARTDCAFKKSCAVVEACDHKGKKEFKPFRCATAKVYDQVAAIEHNKDIAEAVRASA